MDCDISLHGTSSIALHGTDCVVQAVRAYRNGCGGIDISGGDQVCMSISACVQLYYNKIVVVQ